MKYLLTTVSALCLLSTSVYAGDLTVKDTIGVYGALSVLTQPYQTICKEGSVEKQCTKRYSFKPGVLRALATNMTATKAVNEAYVDSINNLVKLYSDGGSKVPEDKMGSFVDAQNKILRQPLKDFSGVELKLACVNFEDLKLEDNPELPIGVLADLEPVTTGCKQ